MELRDLNGFEGFDRNIWNMTYSDRDMEYEIWNMMKEIWMISCIIDMEYIYNSTIHLIIYWDLDYKK
jgi:hypothetical protein